MTAHILHIEVTSELSDMHLFTPSSPCKYVILKIVFCIGFTYMPSIFHNSLFQVNENSFITKMSMNKTVI